MSVQKTWQSFEHSFKYCQNKRLCKIQCAAVLSPEVYLTRSIAAEMVEVCLQR